MELIRAPALPAMMAHGAPLAESWVGLRRFRGCLVRFDAGVHGDPPRAYVADQGIVDRANFLAMMGSNSRQPTFSVTTVPSSRAAQ